MKKYPKIDGTYLLYICPFPDSVRPPHFVPLSECADIISSMKKHGWAERPLIGFKARKRIQCITGSHRIYSARKTGLNKIPVLIIKNNIIELLKKNGLSRKYFIEFFYHEFPERIISKDIKKKKAYKKIMKFISMDY
ncbi:ParB N-terminal domain-containing protein [Candidatus Pacearchaeota archaeon]|nr:ParB N-terminal domain-containing protein [Candidatus Pacearchaeota archaeon]